MVPIRNNNSERCVFRKGNRCTNERVSAGIIVNDSMQSRWQCANCAHFAPFTESGEMTVSH